MTKRNGLEIKHGWYTSGLFPIYRNTKRIMYNLPPKFRVLLEEKWWEHWHWKNFNEWDGILEFTYTKDEKSGISSMAIVHPRDQFNRKIGNKITVGRIKRMKGDLKKCVYDTEVVNDKKKLKRNDKGEPIITREVFFIPYATTPKWIDAPI